MFVWILILCRMIIEWNSYWFCSGIVLKNAKMTKKGKCNANVAIGVVVETLVILSDDLVQVVAKV